MKNFLALDLEMNQPSGSIIQVGICIGNMEMDPSEYKYESHYVNVDEEISEYITNLTHITNDDIRTYGQPLENIAEIISDLVKSNECFVNPVTWGGGDVRTLLQEFNAKGIEFKCFGRRFIDVKTIYTFMQLSCGKNVSGGLSSCMGTYNLSFTGTKHDAGIDAFNTMKFFFYLVERQSLFSVLNSNFTTIQNLRNKYK